MFKKDDKVLEKCIELIIENISRNKFKKYYGTYRTYTFTNAINSSRFKQGFKRN